MKKLPMLLAVAFLSFPTFGDTHWVSPIYTPPYFSASYWNSQIAMDTDANFYFNSATNTFYYRGTQINCVFSALRNYVQADSSWWAGYVNGASDSYGYNYEPVYAEPYNYFSYFFGWVPSWGPEWGGSPSGSTTIPLSGNASLRLEWWIYEYNDNDDTQPGNKFFEVSYNFVPDNVPPTISAISASQSPNVAGWYKSDVTVSVNASDSIVGLQSVGYVLKSSTGYSESGTGSVATISAARFQGSVDITFTATNNVGNTATVEKTILLDTIPPILSITSTSGG